MHCKLKCKNSCSRPFERTSKKMPRKYTRRQVLRTGAVIGASVGGASIGVTSLAKMQDASTPESTSGAARGLHLDLTGKFHEIHDPSIIRGEDAYYVFCTGSGITVRESS